LTLRGGLLELADAPILPPRLLSGLSDTLGLLAESADEIVAGTLAALRKRLDTAILLPPMTISAMACLLRQLGEGADDLQREVDASQAERAADAQETRRQNGLGHSSGNWPRREANWRIWRRGGVWRHRRPAWKSLSGSPTRPPCRPCAVWFDWRPNAARISKRTWRWTLTPSNVTG
jgi:hypothetical protein